MNGHLDGYIVTGDLNHGMSPFMKAEDLDESIHFQVRVNWPGSMITGFVRDGSATEVEFEVKAVSVS